MDTRFLNSVNFVARHYRSGAFGRRSFFGTPERWAWRRRAVAASVAGVVLAATACYFTFVRESVPQPSVPEAAVTAAPVQQGASLHIEFEKAPLSEVVAEIERVYGVEIGNMPSENYELTLSYDGTADDLVETINELLGTSLTVKIK